jgi:hypothetical protein
VRSADPKGRREEQTVFLETVEPVNFEFARRVLVEGHATRWTKRTAVEGASQATVTGERHTLVTVACDTLDGPGGPFGRRAIIAVIDSRPSDDESVPRVLEASGPVVDGFQLQAEVSVAPARFGEWDWSFGVVAVPIRAIGGSFSCHITLCGRGVDAPGEWQTVALTPYWTGRQDAIWGLH